MPDEHVAPDPKLRWCGLTTRQNCCRRLLASNTGFERIELSGVAGSVLLLMRNRLAVPAFALSLFGAASNTMVYFTNPPPDGFFNLPLTLFIIGFAIFLLWFAHLMKRRGVLS